MEQSRLDELLDSFLDIHILVVGDFFLDEYLLLDRKLSEISLETNLEAYQVVDVHCSPGAAGTVCSNLRSLGPGTTALGIIGQDGKAFELKRGLTERGVVIDSLIERPELFTPTYTKPMMREPDGREHELQRLDTKTRRPVSADVEQAIIDRLRVLVSQVDGVIIAVDLLLNYNLGYKVSLGKKVIVVGGGDVAMDAARTALRAMRRRAHSSARARGPCRRERSHR